MIRLLLLIAVVLLAGCWSRESADTRTVEVERRVGTEQGKPTDLRIERRIETAETRQGSSGVDPAAIVTLVRSAVADAVPGAEALAGAVARILPPPPSPEQIKAAAAAAQPKVMGLTLPELGGIAAAAWGGERAWAIHRRRRERRPGDAPAKGA